MIGIQRWVNRFSANISIIRTAKGRFKALPTNTNAINPIIVHGAPSAFSFPRAWRRGRGEGAERQKPKCVRISATDSLTLSAVVGSTLNVLSIFLQQDIGVLFAGTFRGGDIVLFASNLATISLAVSSSAFLPSE
jgi:hypothetical protein